MKSKLSIRPQHLHIGTNEARRSPTLIPLHLTHFIDSPCFPNEMLNISPSAEARWQPLLWRWRERERTVTVSHTHTRMCVKLKYRCTHALPHTSVELNNHALDPFVPSYRGPFSVEVIGSPDINNHVPFFWFFSLFALIECQRDLDLFKI